MQPISEDGFGIVGYRFERSESDWTSASFRKNVAWVAQRQVGITCGSAVLFFMITCERVATHRDYLQVDCIVGSCTY